jgi:hypothetical protein
VARRRMPRADKSVISALRSQVFRGLRVIYEDEVLLVSPSFDDAELERVLLSVLSTPLSIIDIQRVFSGLVSGERIKRVLDDLVRRGVVKFVNGVYVVSQGGSV